MKKQITKNRGFTLVETMVAISILSLSILAAFTAVQLGISKSLYAKDQTTAFYLAQEAFEVIQNVRDQNGLANISSLTSGGSGVNWLHGISELSSDPCYFGNTCEVDSAHPGLQPLFTLCGVGSVNCPYLNEDTAGPSPSYLFGYTSSWPVSRFRRQIKLTQINSNEIVVSVSVAWSSDGMPYFIQFQQSLFDIR